MFNFFKRKPKQIATTVKIWMTEQARNLACIALAEADKSVIFVAWFEETKDSFTQFAATKGVADIIVQLAEHLHGINEAQKLIFLEHHPLQSEEQKKFATLALPEATIYTSMEEPIFGVFGGERIVALMQKMGMKPDDVIEHNMITKSLKRAQDKIAEKAIITGRAYSQKAWLLNAGIRDNV